MHMIAWMRKAFANKAGSRSIRFTSILMLVLLSLLMLSLEGCKGVSDGMLNPKGIIAFHERKLLFDTLALMLIVVLPVIVMSLTFVYHYQVSHHIADYEPNWSHNYFLESIWWGVPCAIIFILAVITWKKTHELDPYNSIAGATEPALLVEAIALPWKWLFIYPEQNIATVNYLEIPVGRQVEIWMTTDNVPMSAFFVAQLGSQIYAMAGMRTKLHILANQTGVYHGQNTQYNGAGFSEMHFPVHVVEPEQMNAWVDEIRKNKSHHALSPDEYQRLLVPSIANKPAYYVDAEKNLFEHVMHTYMHTFGPKHPREPQVKIEGNSHA